jgi:hypothetical protein
MSVSFCVRVSDICRNLGHSADITIMVKPEDTDLLMLVGETSHGAVRGGDEGVLGLGGQGGNGGDGGAGSRYYNNNTNSWVTVPGGSGGYAGINGNNGEIWYVCN